ncbi:MAG TPA: hypothetical protein VLX32_05025 [Candidatus Acidoferrum sp.]|nr:hypothetical protein [Candidatus Acidoferrum sp.]
MLLAISTVALAQFGLFYWRAIIAGVAAEPVSGRVLEAAHVAGGELSGKDFDVLAELHDLTPDLRPSQGGLGFVRVYYKAVQLVGALAANSLPAVFAWAEREGMLCARYAAVQVDRRLQANLALAASIRSC